jgi:alkylphosphonate utilization operon protein PhnA
MDSSEDIPTRNSSTTADESAGNVHKGSSITLKVGTKVKSIRLVDGDHEVDCKMDAGSFMLKACYLRKV